MTAAITLPAEAVRVGDLWVWTVPGQCGNCGAPGAGRGCDVRGAGNRHPRCIEAGFVTPEAWAQHDKPCKLCEGDGWLREYNGMDPKPKRVKCRLCRDGRQVWELRTFDPGERYKRASAHALVARVTVQVAPVVADPDQVIDGKVGVYVRDGWAYLILADGEVDGPFKIDPLPTPGRDFAVVARAVTP